MLPSASRLLCLYLCLLTATTALQQQQQLFLDSAWRAIESACAAGRCVKHSNATRETTDSTDCKVRMLMYEYGNGLIPALSPQREVFDALELQSCG